MQFLVRLRSAQLDDQAAASPHPVVLRPLEADKGGGGGGDPLFVLSYCCMVRRSGGGVDV